MGQMTGDDVENVQEKEAKEEKKEKRLHEGQWCSAVSSHRSSGSCLKEAEEEGSITKVTADVKGVMESIQL